MSELRAKIIRNFLSPFYWQIFKKSKVLNYLKILRKNQWKSFEENKRIQQKKLYDLVNYTINNIPYYQKITQERKIRISEGTIFEDIKIFPILNKDILRKNFNQLYKFKDKTYFRNTSGGSTGEPVIFYQDRDYRDWNFATKILFDEWTGRKIGERKIKLWGSERDIFEGGKGLRKKLKEILWQEKFLNSFKMSEENMKNYIKIINQWQPKLIFSYTSSIDELAKFIEREGIKIHFSGAIMTSAGVLYPEIRNKVQNIFKTSVFDYYGSREIGTVACECELHQGLHTNPFTHFIEIIDKEGNQVEEGERGELLITSLTNYTMPLIRYKIGDLAEKKTNFCSCGRGWPMIDSLVGRIVDVFKNSKGELIDGEYFSHLFYFRNWVKKYQVIQTEINKIVVKVALVNPNQKPTDPEKEEIVKKIKLVIGNNCQVDFEFVKEIPPSPSGKYLYTISKINK